MLYKDKNIYYRKGENIYCGIIDATENGEKTLVGFKPFYLLSGKDLEEKYLHVIMMDNSYKLYEIEKIKIDHIDELDEDNLIETCNKVFKQYNNIKYN